MKLARIIKVMQGKPHACRLQNTAIENQCLCINVFFRQSGLLPIIMIIKRRQYAGLHYCFAMQSYAALSAKQNLNPLALPCFFQQKCKQFNQSAKNPCAPIMLKRLPLPLII